VSIPKIESRTSQKQIICTSVPSRGRIKPSGFVETGSPKRRWISGGLVDTIPFQTLGNPNVSDLAHQPSTRSTLRRYEHLYIDGAWVKPIDGELVESIDPATGQPWAVVPMGGTQDIDRAVAAARRAFAGPWRRIPGHERAALMRRFADLFAAAAPELALLESRDNGGLVRDLRASLPAQVQWYQWFASLADKTQGTTIPIDDSVHAFTTREPLGVVGAILPWNVPLMAACMKIGPALAAGCTVVLKPAEQTPVTALELARLAHEAGFPPGVLNVVPGYGRTWSRTGMWPRFLLPGKAVLPRRCFATVPTLSSVSHSNSAVRHHTSSSRMPTSTMP
jgi:hypothetical protein